MGNKERHNKMKVAITARNFTSPDKKALELLLENGFEVLDYTDKNCGTGTPEEEIASYIKDADIAITGLEPVGEKVFTGCQNLKLISRRGIGFDSVDLKAAKSCGIHVVRTAGAVEAAVAEQVMAYILHFARRLDVQNASMHQAKWVRTMTYGAKNRTIGLVGFGGIGKEVAKRANAFGMHVIYTCRHPKKEWEKEYNASYRPFEQLLSESDYISVNVPLTDATRGMFKEEQFHLMKPECVFINIARGPIVDVNALKKALDHKWIRGAGVDVFDLEPCTDSPLISCENAILTPHTAPYTSENFAAMNLQAAKNVVDYFSGNIEEKYVLL